MKTVTPIPNDPRHCFAHCPKHGWTKHYKKPDTGCKRGFSPQCMECKRECYRRWRTRHRDQENKRKREWYKEHCGEEQERFHGWYIKHQERERKRRRQYYVGHPEQARKRSHDWYVNHIQERREYNSEWNKQHPERRRELNREATQKRLSTEAGRLIANLRTALWGALNGSNATGAFCNLPYDPREYVAYIQEQLEGQGYICPLCGEPYCETGGYNVDHIIPLAPAKGNIDKILELFALKNLRPICPDCNRKKGAKDNYI